MKKKLLLLVLTLICVLNCTLGLTACNDNSNSSNNGNNNGNEQAEELPATEGLEFREIEGGYEVTGLGSATETDIVIPSKYNDKPVISIYGTEFIDNSVESGFFECENITSVVIPDSVISIGWFAFAFCSNLTSVTIGNGVTSIGMFAFSGCDNLSSIIIPDSVIFIDGYTFYDNSFTSMVVANGNTRYHSKDNCIIETESKTLVAGCASSIIPDDGSVTSIGHHAFAECHLLTSVTIPDSVTSIESSAFYEIDELTSVTIGKGVTYIGSYAFLGCEITNIFYNGTKAQWDTIEKGSYWNQYTGNYTIHCTDGDIAKS